MATNRISIDLVRVNAVLLSAVLWGCVDNPEVNEPKPPPVYVDVVRERARTPSVEVTAMVQAERRAALRAETAGRVIDAPHRAGATVEAGEVLLRLDLSRPEIGVEQARARLAQAESTLRQARRAREDGEALSAQGANTRMLLEETRDREAEAIGRLEEAQAGVNAAHANVSESVLTAPFDGTLADFRIREGEFVSAGTIVATLVDRSRLESELLLDAEEAAGVQVGGDVVVRATRDRLFSGIIASVGEALDPRTSRLPVRVEIDDPAAELRPGEIARFDLAVGETRQVLVLPKDALVRRHGSTLVFVVSEGRAEARPVRVDGSALAEVAVLDGSIRSGDVVIVAGTERVEDGGQVRVIHPSKGPPTDSGAPEGT